VQEFLPSPVCTALLQEALTRFEAAGYGHLPICIAKTQNSLSDRGTWIGRPRDFRITVRDARLSAGAGFVVVYAGEILTMPGLPEHPAAEQVDLDADGRIRGLF
jgi:formate--tetrahydrofolate ligase